MRIGYIRILFVAAIGTATLVCARPDAALGAPPRTRPAKPPKKPEKPAKPDLKAPETNPQPEAQPTLQRSNRMELDARLVRGEAARSGAVYLFQRAPRQLPPLVDLHQSYLDDIVVPVLGEGEAPAHAVEPTEPPVTTPPAPAEPKVRGKGGR